MNFYWTQWQITSLHIFVFLYSTLLDEHFASVFFLFCDQCVDIYIKYLLIPWCNWHADVSTTRLVWQGFWLWTCFYVQQHYSFIDNCVHSILFSWVYPCFVVCVCVCVLTERLTDPPHSLHCCTVGRDQSIFNIFLSIIHRANLSALLLSDS